MPRFKSTCFSVFNFNAISVFKFKKRNSFISISNNILNSCRHIIIRVFFLIIFIHGVDQTLQQIEFQNQQLIQLHIHVLMIPLN